LLSSVESQLVDPASEEWVPGPLGNRHSVTSVGPGRFIPETLVEDKPAVSCSIGNFSMKVAQVRAGGYADVAGEDLLQIINIFAASSDNSPSVDGFLM